MQGSSGWIDRACLLGAEERNGLRLRIAFPMPQQVEHTAIEMQTAADRSDQLPQRVHAGFFM
jgi:hypothetical protein